MRILLADDQPQVRSALRLLLEHESGVKVVGEALNAKDLLQLTQNIQSDLLLLDWELPGLDVSDLLTMLRADYPCLSIVALSGHMEAQQAALDAGVDAFISKAHPPEKFLPLLRSIHQKTQQKSPCS